jgi:release factor glutamine methyltransferase
LAELASAVSIADAVSGAAKRLERAGCETPRLDAEVLLSSMLQVGRERLVLDRDTPLGIADQQRFDALVARREQREPVAYIVGRKSFRHLTLAVDRRALIPRPETELLVDVGRELAVGCTVADVGTGSGAVALALKHERPDLSVLGTDLDAAAIALARENAIALGLEVEFVEADLLDGVEAGAVLANLPYVAAGAWLPPEIRRYEPRLALYAGADGLDAIRRLVGRLPGVSLAALEVGLDQAAAVAAMLHEAGFTSVEVRADLAGIDRVVLAQR